jgi:ABC-type phosphate/phosphonate transport system ATPase subunit
MAESLGRVRRLCADIDPGASLVGRRSLFWNALAPASGPRALGRLLRLPRRQEREAALAALERVGLRAKADDPVAALSGFDRLRFLIARALARRPRHLVVRDPDSAVGADQIGGLLALLRLLARGDRLGIVVSLVDGTAGRAFADRVLVLGEGLLLFHGRAEALAEPRAAWNARALTR